MVQAVHGWTKEMIDQAFAEQAAQGVADKTRHVLYAPTKTNPYAVNYNYQAKCAAESYAAKARRSDSLFQRYLIDCGLGGKTATVISDCDIRTRKGRYFLPLLVWVACLELEHPNPIEGAIQALDLMGVGAPTDAYYYERAHFVLLNGYRHCDGGAYKSLKPCAIYDLGTLLPSQSQIDAVQRLDALKPIKFAVAAPAALVNETADYNLVQSDEIDFAALYAAQCAAQGITPINAEAAPIVQKPVALMAMIESMVGLSVLFVDAVCASTPTPIGLIDLTIARNKQERRDAAKQYGFARGDSAGEWLINAREHNRMLSFVEARTAPKASRPLRIAADPVVKSTVTKARKPYPHCGSGLQNNPVKRPTPKPIALMVMLGSMVDLAVMFVGAVGIVGANSTETMTLLEAAYYLKLGAKNDNVAHLGQLVRTPIGKRGQMYPKLLAAYDAANITPTDRLHFWETKALPHTLVRLISNVQSRP